MHEASLTRWVNAPMSILHSSHAYRVHEPQPRYVVFLTLNTEYHCRDAVCIAVRNRRTREFDDRHPALGLRMMGGMRLEHGTLMSYSLAEEPRIGEWLFFSGGAYRSKVRTSALCGIVRPVPVSVA
jgi:hypothetical protein